MSHLILSCRMILVTMFLMRQCHTSNSMTITPSSSTPKFQQLQPMLSQGLLIRPRPNLYILGTVHLGSQSAKEAKTLIHTVKPDNVIVEISPSRLRRIRQKAAPRVRENARNEEEEEEEPRAAAADEGNVTGEDGREEGTTGKRPGQNTSLLDAIFLLPALASEGYAKGGISGFLFSTVIVWSSLIKRSTTSQEEEVSLPRTNEFEAAVMAADAVGARVIAADVELEELINTVAQSMKNPFAWIKLGYNLSGQSVGFLPSDPVRRKGGESMKDWEIRRRNVETSRASRVHGERACPELSRVLVDCRDAEFARLCLERLDVEDRDGKGNETTVCVVGLVHLDGVVDICAAGKNT